MTTIAMVNKRSLFSERSNPRLFRVYCNFLFISHHYRFTVIFFFQWNWQCVAPKWVFWAPNFPLTDKVQRKLQNQHLDVKSRDMVQKASICITQFSDIQHILWVTWSTLKCMLIVCCNFWDILRSFRVMANFLFIWGNFVRWPNFPKRTENSPVTSDY